MLIACWARRSAVAEPTRLPVNSHDTDAGHDLDQAVDTESDQGDRASGDAGHESDRELGDVPGDRRPRPASGPDAGADRARLGRPEYRDW